MERLDGKRIIVTGGANGMGQITVEGFVELGAKIVFFDILDEKAAEVAEKTGAKYIHVNVADEEEVKKGIAEAAEYLGGIDVLVHAAGIGPHCPAELITFEDFKKVFAVNVDGTFLTNEAVFPYMKENGGNIINFTSASAYICSPGQAHYGASKGAVTAWTRTLAKDWMKYNIRVNMIAPCIKTPMYEQMRAMMTPEQLAIHDATMKELCIGGEMGDPIKDFLPVMAFAASDSSRFMTGQTLSVDGGIMMVR